MAMRICSPTVSLVVVILFGCWIGSEPKLAAQELFENLAHENLRGIGDGFNDPLPKFLAILHRFFAADASEKPVAVFDQVHEEFIER